MVGRLQRMVAAMVFTAGSAIALSTVATAAPIQPSTMQVVQRRSRSSQAEWLQRLNLSADQMQQIQEIRKRYQDRLTNERQAVRQAQQDLKQLMASNASPEQIRQKFDQLQVLKQKLADTRMESMLAIRTVLNAEQRQKLNEVMRQLGRDR